MTLIDELENNDAFSLFTELIKKRISGAIVSKEKLNEKEIASLEKVHFVEKKLIFDCPSCGNTRLAKQDQLLFKCDCGKEIKIQDVDTEQRYYITEETYEIFKSELISTKDINDNRIKIIFGEKKFGILNHDNSIYIHITPYHNNEIAIFSPLDAIYLDHFVIEWNFVIEFIHNKQKIVNDILAFIDENINQQIDWKKIDDIEFQKLIYEIVDAEKMFDKLMSGGTGADQGKDLIGYTYVQHPVGRPEEVITLIQCKHTKTNASFNSEEILKYVTKAKRHHCTHLLFITNGNLTGDAATEIHSKEAYKDGTFRDVDFWDEHKLFLLLKKHQIIRLKYFYNKK